MRRRAAQSLEEDRGQMTPMIDGTFLLLVFLLATRSRSSPRVTGAIVTLFLALPALVGCRASREAGEPPFAEAQTRIDSEHFEEAVALLEAWLEETPGASPSARAQAHSLAAHGRTLLREPDLALEQLDAAVELAPADPWLHYARGITLQELGDYDWALEAYARALACDPRHVKSAQWRGYTLALLRRHREAVEEYDRALAILAGADVREVASWGGELDELERWTVAARAESVSALGEDPSAPGGH